MLTFGSEAPGRRTRGAAAGVSGVRGRRDAGFLPLDFAELGPGVGIGAGAGVGGRGAGCLPVDLEIRSRCGMRLNRRGGWEGRVGECLPLLTCAVRREGVDGPSPLSRAGWGGVLLGWMDDPLPFLVGFGRGISNAHLDRVE